MAIKKEIKKLNEEEVKKNREIVLNYIKDDDKIKKVDLVAPIKSGEIKSKIINDRKENKAISAVEINLIPNNLSDLETPAILKKNKNIKTLGKVKKIRKPAEKKADEVNLKHLNIDPLPEIKTKSVVIKAIKKKELLEKESFKRLEEQKKIKIKRIEEINNEKIKKIKHEIKHQGFYKVIIRHIFRYIILIFIILFIFYLTFVYMNPLPTVDY